jgi:hypothetical protein
MNKMPVVKEFSYKELTNSSRSCFTTCRKKFFWTYICRLVPQSDNKAFMIGRLFHAGLEAIYKELAYNKQELNLMVDTEVDKSVMACIDAEKADDLWKQSALVKALLEGYAAQWLKQDLKTWKIVAPETTFEFPLKNGWVNRGMRDLLITRAGKLGLVEHKTTTILNANYLAKLPMDSQILGYAISCKKEKSIGRYPDFIVYNVVKKSQIRLKQTETLQQFAQRVVDEYLLNPSAYFYREVLSFSKADLEAYEADLEKFAVEMERSVKEKYYYCNYSACTMYGACQYMPLCQAKLPKAFEEALMSYRVKEDLHEELEP